MKKVSIVLLAVAFVAACTNKPKTEGTAFSSQEEQADSASVRQSYDSLVVAQARAEVDTAYRHSDDFQQRQAAYERMVGAMTESMTEPQRLLYELDLAIQAFRNAGEHFGHNLQLMQDPVNQKTMAVYGLTVRQIRQQLLQQKLSATEQQRLDSLNALIQF